METVKLDVGYSKISGGGHVIEELRPVEITAEEVAEHKTADDRGNRGTTETLYKTTGGRYVVYVHDWSRWQGEPDTWSLIEVVEGDLDVNGRFEMLGREAGLGRPLTLDEALKGNAANDL